MAAVLYRVGRYAYSHRLLVIGVWLLLLLAVGASTTLAKPFVSSFDLPGTESERASQMLDAKFPGQGDVAMQAEAKVVVQATSGATLDAPENVSRVDALVSDLRGLEHLADPESIVNPMTTPALAMQVSPDRTIAYFDVLFDQKFIDVDESSIDEFNTIIQEARDSELTVEATGTLFNGQPPQQGASELLGFGVALIVMVVAFASLVAASLPIITAMVGTGILVASIMGATSFIQMDSSALMIGSMIGIAVSIDYALFIVSRFRHELIDTDDRAHAAGRAVGTAGSSVVFAGLTVVIALVALSVTGIPMISKMGLASAYGVVVAVSTAVTLLPAVLGLFGRKAFHGRIPGLRRGDEPDTVPSNGLRWAQFVVARPIPVLLAAVALLGVLALPVTRLELGLNIVGGEQKKAIELIQTGFGEGVTGPLMVIADGGGAADATAAFTDLAEEVKALDDVQLVAPPELNQDGSGALIVVIPSSGPSSAQTQQLMHQIRDLEPSLAQTTGLQFGVAGQTAMMSDLSDALLKSLAPYLALVIGLAFLVLMLVFRSLLVPLTATLGFLLSVGATFGALVSVFQDGLFGLIDDPGPLISFLPVMLIGLVFGLAMDYQVFLVTRMREEYIHGPRTRAGAKSAVIVGFQHGGRVVTSAAVIMISVFAAFMLSPETVSKSMGFGLAVAVFFDAFIVRMAIIPAVMALLGTSAWYLPQWLDRILPDVDIEGERLRQLTPAVAPPAAPQLVTTGTGGRHRR
ncbi:MAG: MMPL family transporter [Mycobacterium sp.]